MKFDIKLLNNEKRKVVIFDAKKRIWLGLLLRTIRNP